MYKHLISMTGLLVISFSPLGTHFILIFIGKPVKTMDYLSQLVLCLSCILHVPLFYFMNDRYRKFMHKTFCIRKDRFHQDRAAIFSISAILSSVNPRPGGHSLLTILRLLLILFLYLLIHKQYLS